MDGVGANAFTRSHAELDESGTLDAGDRDLPAGNYRELKQMLPAWKVFGGCCGADHGHIGKICDAVFRKAEWNA